MNNENAFQVFEHSTYNIINEGREGKKLPTDLFSALKSYVGEKDLPYFSLTANGVRFKNFVGAIQVGEWNIEILPKLDRVLDEDSTQPILIQMLNQAGFIKTTAPTESQLKLKRNYILEAYLQMFLDETQKLIHHGLIKKYRKKEENKYALKGKLSFNKHINKNITHAERFYVRQTIYDRQHELNRVVLKTLKVILTLLVNTDIVSNTKNLISQFPELNDIQVSDKFFNRICYGRKTEAYKKAIEISKLLLLNYHPDLSQGRNHVLALMFEMDRLWEKWFARRIRIAAKGIESSISIYTQFRKDFWHPNYGKKVSQKPDIIIEFPDKRKIILDTKWKLINEKPSEEDLRQMFTYNQLFKSERAFLVYPGKNISIDGEFFDCINNGTCGLKFVSFIASGRLSSTGIEGLVSELVRLNRGRE